MTDAGQWRAYCACNKFEGLSCFVLRMSHRCVVVYNAARVIASNTEEQSSTITQYDGGRYNTTFVLGNVARPAALPRPRYPHRLRQVCAYWHLTIDIPTSLSVPYSYAIAYSIGQIIKSVCVFPSVRLRAFSRSHFLIDFHQNWH